ncbi:MAG: hypothetical protein IKI84_00650 [Clostridia bacterium]|nr:hypothetical protein [Clostridia bacterium]
MKKSVWIVLIAVFAVSTAGFIYTFVQPRYPATVVDVGRARSVTSHGKHGSRSHTVIPLIVTYTDGTGEKQTVDATYPWPAEQPVPGQEMLIVRSFNGFTVYPFKGLRIFSGMVSLSLGVFLLFMLTDRKLKKGKTLRGEG